MMYLIDNSFFSSENPKFEALLSKCHLDKKRPLCACKKEGIPVYVAKINNSFFVKRMPNTGSYHNFNCTHYDPPPELSGRGEVLGNAVMEDTATGQIKLKFDFSLSKREGRMPPELTDKEKISVKSTDSKLSLKGTLDFLWDEAELNKWSPNMGGKRNWYVIQKYLNNAAEAKIAKNNNLSEMLFIPETFYIDKKDDIVLRRNKKLSMLKTQKGGKPLMIVIAEIKELSSARYGHKIIAKHLSDFHFFLTEDLTKQLYKHFNVPISFWEADQDCHLLMIATFGLSAAGFANIEEIAVSLFNNNWLPFQSISEKQLIDELITNHRRFIKGLRYNMTSDQPLVIAVLTDTEQPTALYIVEQEATDEYKDKLSQLIKNSDLKSWVWDLDAIKPPLPGNNHPKG